MDLTLDSGGDRLDVSSLFARQLNLNRSIKQTLDTFDLSRGSVQGSNPAPALVYVGTGDTLSDLSTCEDGFPFLA